MTDPGFTASEKIVMASICRRKEKDMTENEQLLRKKFEEIIEEARGDATEERMLLVVEKGYRLGYGKGYAAAERNCGAVDEEPMSRDNEQPRERSGSWFA